MIFSLNNKDIPSIKAVIWRKIPTKLAVEEGEAIT